MKKIFCLVCFFLALFSLKSIADVPEGAIPFVFDGHLYLQSTLNDTIPVTLIYDTGADFLYLDEDYLKLNHLQNAFGRKGKATMGGAGNGEPERIDIFILRREIDIPDMMGSDGLGSVDPFGVDFHPVSDPAQTGIDFIIQYSERVRADVEQEVAPSGDNLNEHIQKRLCAFVLRLPIVGPALRHRHARLPRAVPDFRRDLELRCQIILVGGVGSPCHRYHSRLPFSCRSGDPSPHEFSNNLYK